MAKLNIVQPGSFMSIGMGIENHHLIGATMHLDEKDEKNKSNINSTNGWRISNEHPYNPANDWMFDIITVSTKKKRLCDLVGKKQTRA